MTRNALIAGLLLGSMLTGCGDEGDVALAPIEATQAALDACDVLDWRLERIHRQAAIDTYVLGHPADFDKFVYAPLGNAGVPVIMFRLFQDVFPDIWGAPGEGFGKVGLAPEPWVPGRALPMGLGHSGSSYTVPVPVLGDRPIHVIQLTCMACHGGRVVGPDGNVITLLGAPSTEFNQFRVAIARTVSDPRYTADHFRAALAGKPALGWLYGSEVGMLIQEQVERNAFGKPGAAEQFLAGLRARVEVVALRSAATIDACTYNPHANAPDRVGPKPGSLDAIGAGISLIADPALLGDAVCDVMPDAPAEIDPMSVWRQADRPMAQWDNSIVSPVHRQLASAFAIVGRADALDVEVAVRTTHFTHDLPPPPYPFDVGSEAAARGRQLYDTYCASCHAPGNAYTFTPEQVGTDANRARIWSPFALNTLLGVLRAACTDPGECGGPGGTLLPDHEILQAIGGYAAVPLAGVWARAPYLHNGSVPTLYHLLVPASRPKSFYRGNIHYDQAKVGFVWDQGGANVHLFDTTRAGASNGGHDTAEFLGDIDWASQPGELADLLEYLKTL